MALFLRSAASLEPPDIRVLVEISRPRPDSYPDADIVGTIRHDQLRDVLPPDQRHLLQPIVAALIREGLVLDEAIGTWDYEPKWSLSPYGFAFLQFLPGEDLPDLGSAVLVGVHRRAQLMVKNLGPGHASLIDVSVTSDGGELLGSVRLPIELAAGERVELPSTQIERSRDAHIRLSWRTADGGRLASDRTSSQR